MKKNLLNFRFSKSLDLGNRRQIRSLKHNKKQSMTFTTRSIKNLTLLQIITESQKEWIALQNQMKSFL